MVRRNLTRLLLLMLVLVFGTVSFQAAPPPAAAKLDVSFEAEATSLVDSSCIKCHGQRTETPLNFEHVGFDLSDRETFKTWERVFERVTNGEMPPRGARKPKPEVTDAALGKLKSALVSANLERRGEQRTPLRRLTRLEWEHTVADLLLIDEAEAKEVGHSLPVEADTGGFDVVAAKQGISSLHVRSYLEAANEVLDVALKVGPRPKKQNRVIKYVDSQYLRAIQYMDSLGGGIVEKLDDAYAVFFDTGSTYTLHTQSEGWEVPFPGRYRVKLEAYPYQATTPVTLNLFRGVKSGSSAVLNDLLGSFDLVGDEHGTFEVTTFLRPGELLSPAPADLVVPPGLYPNEAYLPGKNISDYPGEGIAVKSLSVEGPLLESWPPESTRELLQGVDFDIAEDGSATVRLTKDPYAHIKDVVARFAPLAFRRPLVEGELEAYAELAKPFLTFEAGQSQKDRESTFLTAVRVPLRGILSSPQFLFHADLDPGASGGSSIAESSGGFLDDFALANRLSYFLWRSMPDAELFQLAAEDKLSDPKVLAAQVDRLLDDRKSVRFLQDFAGQAFRLYELKATSPDPGLYPEYDAQLGQAMQWETELFLTELFKEDVGASNLIASDFTFVNRKLAEHYGIPGIKGQEMRRVKLAEDSPRGGLLTQASILKITANGTTTSPIPRGNFVLTNLLGQPAPPPPAGIEGLEPDTRGATTIREQLAKHRNETVCNSCHRKIDPPGFALESFDPVGGFREWYRIPGEAVEFDGVKYPGPSRKGPDVDSTGTTPDGADFADINEYKKLLLASDTDQVARNMVAQLLTFGTGAEVEFADQDAVDRITAGLADRGYPLRTMIRDVVTSDIFKRR